MMKHMIKLEKSLWLVWIFIFIACTSPTNKQNKGDLDPMNNALKENNTANKDTLIIDFPAAIFFTPDSVQYNKIKGITDSAVFESLMHECVYQMGYSRRTIEQHWPKLKMVESKNHRLLLFKSKNESIQFMDLSGRMDPCGLLVFDGKKMPKLIDMTNLDTEIGYYLKD